jgi:hypothetical protein
MTGFLRRIGKAEMGKRRDLPTPPPVARPATGDQPAEVPIPRYPRESISSTLSSAAISKVY